MLGSKFNHVSKRSPSGDPIGTGVITVFTSWLMTSQLVAGLRGGGSHGFVYYLGAGFRTSEPPSPIRCYKSLAAPPGQLPAHQGPGGQPAQHCLATWGQIQYCTHIVKSCKVSKMRDQVLKCLYRFEIWQVLLGLLPIFRAIVLFHTYFSPSCDLNLSNPCGVSY